MRLVSKVSLPSLLSPLRPQSARLFGVLASNKIRKPEDQFRFSAEREQKKKDVWRLRVVFVPLLLCSVGGSFYLFDYLVERNYRQIHDYFSKQLLWDSKWDVKEEEEGEEGVGADARIVENRERFERENHCGSRKLVFVRHGQFNVEEKKAKKQGLTEMGRKQAEMTGKRLRELLEGEKVSSVFYSPTPRASQTAEIIYEQLAGGQEEASAEDDSMRFVRLEGSSLLQEAIPCLPDPPTEKLSLMSVEPEEVDRLEKGFKVNFF